MILTRGSFIMLTFTVQCRRARVLDTEWKHAFLRISTSLYLFIWIVLFARNKKHAYQSEIATFAAQTALFSAFFILKYVSVKLCSLAPPRWIFNTRWCVGIIRCLAVITRRAVCAFQKRFVETWSRKIYDVIVDCGGHTRNGSFCAKLRFKVKINHMLSLFRRLDGWDWNTVILALYGDTRRSWRFRDDRNFGVRSAGHVLHSMYGTRSCR